MQPALTVNHRSGRYPIHIGAGLLQRSGDLLGEVLASSSRPVIITDENVMQYFERFAASIRELSAECRTPLCIEVPAGEASKSITQIEKIWNELLEARIDRQTTVIALGGGVVGDLAGYVAASWLRGVRFVQVPTTLLAQVDSSVGGKTGINLPKAKNTVGAFWQPASVVIDPSVLQTLDPREYTSGLAEVVKYGVIMDAGFLEFLEDSVEAINRLDMQVLEKVIRRCCELKAQVVEADERETGGRRAILNYGHTFGHAIEAVFGYGTWPHGHAVAMGMHAAAHLAEIQGLIDSTLIDRQAKLLGRLNIPFLFPQDHHAGMLDAMQHDKKATAGNPRFILPTRMGNVQLVSSIDRAAVLESMKRACQATS